MSLNPTNPSLAKAILITHLIIAQDEVNKLMGSSLSSSNKLNLVNKIDPMTNCHQPTLRTELTLPF